MKKRMTIMLIALGVLFGCIFTYKLLVNMMIKRFLAANKNPVISVSSMKVGYALWSPHVSATGTVRAINGVDVTTELAGMVQYIYFNPGIRVKKGDLLVQLIADNDIAKLQSLKANAELAKITYNRDKAQFEVQAVSKQTVDTDYQNLQSLNAQVTEQAAIVAKKTIKAPFSGRVGIVNIDIGQYLTPGNKITTLQMLDPVYVDFYMPQQALAQLKLGQQVVVTTDTFPNKKFLGKVTTIEPSVDVTTRNVLIEATLPNPTLALTPGMFANIEVITGAPEKRITVPLTVLTFNPYGDTVWIIEEAGKNEKEKTQELIVKQVFVQTGETRGEQITILKGLKGGQTIVTSGQLKLKKNSKVKINNTIQLPDNPHPVAPNGY